MHPWALGEGEGEGDREVVGETEGVTLGVKEEEEVRVTVEDRVGGGVCEGLKPVEGDWVGAELEAGLGHTMRRILCEPESPTKMRPRASTVTPRGEEKVACRENPSAEPALAVPAMVDTAKSLPGATFTMRMRLFPASATSSWLGLARAMCTVLEKENPAKTPGASSQLPMPFPAMVLTSPSLSMRMRRLLSTT